MAVRFRGSLYTFMEVWNKSQTGDTLEQPCVARPPCLVSVHPSVSSSIPLNTLPLDAAVGAEQQLPGAAHVTQREAEVRAVQPFVWRNE